MATTTRAKTTAPEPDPLTAAQTDAEQAAAAAREAAARVEALRAEKDQEQAALEAARQPLIEKWEALERQEWPMRWRGVVDEAWGTFVAAVRDGGDTVAAWVQYRRARRLSAADRSACEAWLADQNKRVYEQRRDAWKPLHEEAILIDGHRDKADRDPQLRERLAELLASTATFTGTPVEIPEARAGEEVLTTLRAIFLALNDHKPYPPPHRTIRTNEPDDGFAAAVDRVVKQLEDQAANEAAAERLARRTAYVEAQLQQQ